MMNGIIHKYQYKVNCTVIKLRIERRKKMREKTRSAPLFAYDTTDEINFDRPLFSLSLFLSFSSLSFSFLFKCRLHSDGVFSTFIFSFLFLFSRFLFEQVDKVLRRLST